MFVVEKVPSLLGASKETSCEKVVVVGQSAGLFPPSLLLHSLCQDPKSELMVKCRSVFRPTLRTRDVSQTYRYLGLPQRNNNHAP
jgi:hypothetical protein